MSEMVDHCISRKLYKSSCDEQCVLAFVGNGGSDFINRPKSVEPILREQEKIIRRLVEEAELKHICWGTVPDPAQSLCFSDENKAKISKLVSEYNARIREIFPILKDECEGVNFVFIDGESIFSFLIKNAAMFGITRMDRAYSNITFGDCERSEGQVSIKKMMPATVVLEKEDPDRVCCLINVPGRGCVRRENHSDSFLTRMHPIARTNKLMLSTSTTLMHLALSSACQSGTYVALPNSCKPLP